MSAAVETPPTSTGGGGGGFVPVQLTAITPVRVYDVHGEYFETEMDLDAPMRVLQLAVEDFFKVKPEVQLLLHNRQQINPELTLRGNGCLLLKGDPYVKLVLVLKRGPVLNLVCHVANAQQDVLPIAIHERSTVWEAKRVLCAEMAAKRPSSTAGPTPQQLRLLWRYMELNDKAELHYYRILTNSVLTVRIRRGAGRGRSGSPPTHRPAAAAAVAGGGVGGQSWATLRQQRGPAPLPMAPYDLRGGSPPPRVEPQHVVVVPPVAAAPPASSSGGALAEVRDLQANVVALQQELALLRAEVAARQQSAATLMTSTAQALTQQSRQFGLAASHRIQELEETVGRFQAFLQRALLLIP